MEPDDSIKSDDGEPLEKPEPTVVGIGASAGGLAALKIFFDHVPDDSGLAFVVVVHLSPEHESHLADLLQNHVDIPVEQVSETVRLRPDHVYVIPPNANLSAIDTHLRLTSLEDRPRERAPIDHFFRTLAEMHDGHAIGVVLTGTGSDGTLGIKAIKEKGGLTIVQEPAEAEYDGMPQSALATGLIDVVRPVAGIPEVILRYANTEPRVRVTDEDGDFRDTDRHLLQKIFAQLRARTGRDFTRYKRATVMRRIRRRMQLYYVEDLEAYLGQLQERPDEVEALADDLLITVTNFFRDPDVFEYLAEHFIPNLFEGKSPDDTIRVWSVGCATGEEAYSITMLLLEEATRREMPPNVQVFASDLHERSLGMAREGIYHGDIESEVSPERLKRFFTKENEDYRVKEEVKEIVVFAPHNLLGDPPFSRMDLILCRNVLIYLERAVHPDVLSLFHYALRPDGVLALGSSEAVDGQDLFYPVEKQFRIFRKRNVPSSEPRLPVFPVTYRRRADRKKPGEGLKEMPAYERIHDQMVEQFGPPSMLVGPEDRILHLSTNVGRYLVHPGGELTSSVYRLVREEFRIELQSALRSARKLGEPQRSKPVPVDLEGRRRVVTLDVQPATSPEQEGFALVIFNKYDAPAATEEPAADAVADGRDRELEAELKLTKERLQVVIEEYESTQEEMKAANEELHSVNEELRSTMEELETSKEELQSMNEELQTVNQENKHKVDELAQLSSDLQNLLAVTDIATLFLDRKLHILRFTPKVSEIFNMRMSDRGRPISDLTHRLGYGDLVDDAEAVLRRLIPIEREVQDESGRWYLTKVRPYRSTDNRIEGVVLTFVDITSRKKMEDDVRASKVYAESIVETLHEPLLVLTPDYHVQSANPAFYEHFQVRPEETEGRLIYELGNNQWDIPELRTLLEDVLPDNTVFSDYEVAHTFESIGERVMLLNARRLDHVQLILLGIRDITERKQHEEALRRSEERLQKIINVEGVGVMTFTEDGTLVDANDTFLKMHGFSREDIEGREMTWRDLTPEEYIEVSEQQFERLRKTGRIGPYEKEYIGKNGARSWMLFAGASLGDGTTVEYCIDVSDRKEAERALRRSEERYRTLFESIDEGFCIVEVLFDDGEPVDYRFLETNPAFTRHTGMENAEGKRMRELEPSHETHWFETYGRIARTGEPERFVRRSKYLDGRWFDVYAFRVGDPKERRVAVLFNDVTERKETEEALRRLKDTLEARVEERTRQARELASRLTMAEQEERRRISRILHDDLQQVLYGIEMKLSLVMRDLADENLADTAERIGGLRDWVGRAVATTRRLSVDLSPPILQNEGLVDAVEWLQRQMQELHGLKVRLETKHEWYMEDQDMRVLLFQIVRELLFNVTKHARVDEATVRFEERDEHLVIHVVDEGAGFDPEAQTSGIDGATGLGLASAAERLELLGGQLNVYAKPGDGTHVEVHTPVRATS